jgi:hypothetical protein
MEKLAGRPEGNSACALSTRALSSTALSPTGDLCGVLDGLMLLQSIFLPYSAAVAGWGVQEGSKEPWVVDATCALQSAEDLVA